ncbi:MEDS domain-containing protein [Streptomyces sp. NPDC048361]|uniref:MEDS domain-containing protein n=1 Tax=Streptomyces sp. NPDC048361 TaxID=3154720 RepID=UPI00343FD190
MRAARALATLDEVELGDHVCWRMRQTGGSLADTRAFVADGALYGDKIVIVGSTGAVSRIPRDAGPAVSVVVDVPGAADADFVLAAVRREARTAVREGFRSVRVLNERTPPKPVPGAEEELLAQELKLDQFASESGAIVVCAVTPSGWDASTLEHMACVHPHEVGMRAEHPAFRMFSTGADSWSVDGVIDSQCAPVFSAAVRAAALRVPTLTLRFDTVDMIDAAGMHALVDAVRGLPDRRVLVEGANDTVRLCWNLAGYATSDTAVVMGA